MALILRNGGSQSPDRWLKEPRNNQNTGEGIREASKWYELAARKNVIYAIHITVLSKKILAYSDLQVVAGSEESVDFIKKIGKKFMIGHRMR